MKHIQTFHQLNESKPEMKKVKCDCICHKSKGTVKHIRACCDNGYKLIPVKPDKKD